MKNRWVSLGLLLALLVAAGLALARVPLVRTTAAPTLQARHRAGALPTDPGDAAWGAAPALTLPLSAVATPAGTAREVRVQALHNGQMVAFRLDWADPSQELSTTGPVDFADAAAVQINDGKNVNICMGQMDRISHLWHWKSDWQYGSRDVAGRFPNAQNDGFQVGEQRLLTEPLYTNPAGLLQNPRALPRPGEAEHLIAGGFGTLTPAGPQNVHALGQWAGGRWSVVFSRTLGPGEAGDLDLAAVQAPHVAFAIWDGKLMQRNGMKFTTTWSALSLAAVPGPPGARGLLVMLAAVLGALVLSALAYRRWRPGVS